MEQCILTPHAITKRKMSVQLKVNAFLEMWFMRQQFLMMKIEASREPTLEFLRGIGNSDYKITVIPSTQFS